MKSETQSTHYFGWWKRLDVGALLGLGDESFSVFWSSAAENVSIIGFGSAGEKIGTIEWDNVTPDGLPGPFFGGWAFDPMRVWPGWSSERWFLPKVLCWWNGTEVFGALFSSEKKSAIQCEAELAALTDNDFASKEVKVRSAPAAVRLGNLGLERDSWSSLVGQALSEIDQGAFSKLVLARQIQVQSETALAERVILKRLEARFPSCLTFLLRGSDGSSFIGATPETLCCIEDGMLSTEALAGTEKLGNENALVSSEKDRREHQSVVDSIRASLTPFASEISISPVPGFKKLANVVHLNTPIKATLKSGVDPIQLAKALHPTPAVGGVPTEKAVAWLAEHEGFHRGWYTGVVGARRDDRLDLRVALRSCLMKDTNATVFVGAGVVQGSTADSEWIETENKAQAMLSALGVKDV